MDHKALADFNKYTLFLSGAGFIYTLEKYALASPSCSAVIALILFLSAFVAGVLVFATVTASMHSDEKAQKNKSNIKNLGISHAVLLIGATVVLAWLVGWDVYSAFLQEEQLSPFRGWK